jgi:putative addiction module component (TIGR02574 family)
MSSDLSSFDHLSFPEKLQLVGDLWDRIANSPELLPIPDWQKEELDRREANYAANPTPLVGWEEAKRRIREANGS